MFVDWEGVDGVQLHPPWAVLYDGLEEAQTLGTKFVMKSTIRKSAEFRILCRISPISTWRVKIGRRSTAMGTPYFMPVKPFEYCATILTPYAGKPTQRPIKIMTANEMRISTRKL